MKSIAAAVTVAFLAACSGADDRGAVTPSTSAPVETAISPPPVPTATIPPFPAIGPPIKTSGWIVFHRGLDLWAASLDGDLSYLLVEGALGSQFAGMATAPGGVRALYFAALTNVTERAGVIDDGTVEVRRMLLSPSGPVELITSFQISGEQARTFRFSPAIASVSPDGSHLAYSDASALWLRDINAGTSRRLLGNNNDESCDDVSIGLCSSFGEPSWSPAGEWLVLTRGLYDGSVADFIRPLEPVTEYTSDIGALWREWSADGTQICGPEGGLQASGWAVVKPGEPIIRDDGATTLAGKQRDLDEEMRAAGIQVGGWVTDCAWAPDGRIAMQYMHDDRGYDQRIAVIAPDGSLVSDIDHPMFQSSIAGWLPDQSGFILVYSDGEGRPTSYIVLLDGSVRSLAVQIDDVVAVLPE